MTKILLGLLVLFGASLAAVFYFSSSKKQESGISPSLVHDVVIRGSHAVHLADDPEHPRMTVVNLYDTKTSSETRLMTLSEVYRDHYHPAEFIDGTLYVIKRIGESEGPSAQNWTDELWKYDQSGSGTKIFSEKGLDFRVSPDGKSVAIFIQGKDAPLIFIDHAGNVVKTVAEKEVPGFAGQEKRLGPLFWDEGLFWFRANQSFQVTDIYVMDTANDSVTAHAITALRVIGGEFAIEPKTRVLAFSDFVSAGEAVTKPITVSLYIYDLTSGRKEKLVTVVTDRGLAPTWTDGSTIEYNDPHGTGRLTISTATMRAE